MIAFGSSEPAVTIPRGRWYLKERPIKCLLLASSAEASVSPSQPFKIWPLKVKFKTFS